jgi:hypothetical protein
MFKKAVWQSLLLLLFAAATAVQVHADQIDDIFSKHWGVRIGLSHSSWGGLGDLEPIGRGGPFESTALGMEIEGYFSVAKSGDNWVYGGLATGIAGYNTGLIVDNDAEDESALDTLYINAVVKYRFREPGRDYIEVEGGLGYYLASSKYIDCSVVPDCFGAEADSSTVGGFIGVGGRVLGALVIGARVHYANFGTIEAIGPDSGELSGPILTAYASWEFDNF